MRIRGGRKNSEDEVLEAVVTKYGTKQLSRVSSPVASNSVRQGKSRLSEWLEPSIRETAWTEEENETLLHLLRSLPVQWGTSAVRDVRRTVSRCPGGYEELSIAACSVAKDSDRDRRKLRPREIDPNPASKPRCPNPVGTDDEEREMEWEAPVWLANTAVMKAKRKDRKRLFSEINELSMKIGRAVDCNATTDFEKPPPSRFRCTADVDYTVRKKTKFLTKIDAEAQVSKPGVARTWISSSLNTPKMIRQGNDSDDLCHTTRKKAKIMVLQPQIPEQHLSTSFHAEQNTGGLIADPVLRKAQAEIQQRLRSDVTVLRRPKNEHRTCMKEVSREDEPVEDMTDGVAIERAQAQAKQGSPLVKRSRVLRGDLPMPPVSILDRVLMDRQEDNGSCASLPELEQADALIQREALLLLEHDNAKYPTGEVAANETKRRSWRASCIPELQVFDENELREAKSLLEQETELLRTEINHKDASSEDFP